MLVDWYKMQLTFSPWVIHVENIKIGKHLRSCYFFQDIGKLESSLKKQGIYEIFTATETTSFEFSFFVTNVGKDIQKLTWPFNPDTSTVQSWNELKSAIIR